MQINLHKIDQFWDTNKQGGGGEGGGSHRMRSQLTTFPIQLRKFERQRVIQFKRSKLIDLGAWYRFDFDAPMTSRSSPSLMHL